jgi:hypothetical protein
MQQLAARTAHVLASLWASYEAMQWAVVGIQTVGRQRVEGVVYTVTENTRQTLNLNFIVPTAETEKLSRVGGAAYYFADKSPWIVL